MTNRLMLGDCLERMAEIEDGSVDLILSDLPYGTTACKWDVVIPFEPLWAHYRRILKPRGAVVLTASQPFTSMLVMSNREWFRYEWIVEKSVGTGFLDAKRKPLKVHESAVVFYGKSGTYNPQYQPAKRRVIKRSRNALQYAEHAVSTTDNNGRSCPRSVLYFPKELGTVHPTQKPVALMEYLIRTYSNEGDLVHDSTMGVGTTGVGCVNTGRRFVGIEQKPSYFAIAERRIQQAERAFPLFAGASA